MKRAEAILALVLSLSLAGCVLPGRKKAAKTPPQPQPVQAVAAPVPPRQLSIPQTQVALPPPQPVSPAALATEPPPEETAETPPAQRPQRRPAAPAPPSTRLEPAAPPVAAAPEPARAPIQEIVPAETSRKFQESAQAHKREANQLLQQAQSQRMNQRQAGLARRIEQFIKLSDDAERSGNMREANDFADRALALAKELQSGR